MRWVLASAAVVVAIAQRDQLGLGLSDADSRRGAGIDRIEPRFGQELIVASRFDDVAIGVKAVFGNRPAGSDVCLQRVTLATVVVVDKVAALVIRVELRRHRRADRIAQFGQVLSAQPVEITPALHHAAISVVNTFANFTHRVDGLNLLACGIVDIPRTRAIGVDPATQSPSRVVAVFGGEVARVGRPRPEDRAGRLDLLDAAAHLVKFGERDSLARAAGRALFDFDGVADAVKGVAGGELQAVRVDDDLSQLIFAVVGVCCDPRCDGVCPLCHLDLLAERIELEQRREVQSAGIHSPFDDPIALVVAEPRHRAACVSDFDLAAAAVVGRIRDHLAQRVGHGRLLTVFVVCIVGHVAAAIRDAAPARRGGCAPWSPGRFPASLP